MFNKIKAIKDLRSQAKDMQKSLSTISSTGSGAGGDITITINGNQVITDVTISDELLQNKEKLQEGIKDAFAKAHKDIQKDMAKAMQEMGGLDMLKNLGM